MGQALRRTAWIAYSTATKPTVLLTQRIFRMPTAPSISALDFGGRDRTRSHSAIRSTLSIWHRGACASWSYCRWRNSRSSRESAEADFSEPEVAMIERFLNAILDRF
jgi:hypothetical protein